MQPGCLHMCVTSDRIKGTSRKGGSGARAEQQYNYFWGGGRGVSDQNSGGVANRAPYPAF